MNKKIYGYTVVVVFTVVAVLHLLRALNEWEAVVGGIIVPVWFSWVAVVVAGYLAVRGYSVAKKS